MGHLSGCRKVGPIICQGHVGKLKHFALVEGLVLLSLLVTAVAMGAFAVFESLRAAQSLFTPVDSAKLAFGYTLAFGLLPTLLLAGPLYFGLVCLGKDRWGYVLSAGVLPGILLVLLEPSLSLLVAICGAVEAFVTHVLHRRWGPESPRIP